MFGMKKRIIKKEPRFKSIIGLKIVAIKGIQSDLRFKDIEPYYILFSDKKTYIELEEQDYFSFHDCSSYTRYLNFRESKEDWKRIMDTQPDANRDII